MTKQYAVWIQIEEIDEEADHYEDVDLPEKVAQFDTLKEATEYMNQAVDTVIEHHNLDMVFRDTTIGRVGQ